MCSDIVNLLYFAGYNLIKESSAESEFKNICWAFYYDQFLKKFATVKKKITLIKQDTEIPIF